MRSRALSIFFLCAISGAAVAAAVACGSEGGSTFLAPIDSGTGTPVPTSTGTPIGVTDPDAASVDFPAAPIIDGNTPSNAPVLFGGATFANAGGPCLMEPEPGAMLPKNWLRPRFRWIPDQALATDGGTPQSIFELRLHVEGQTNDLVVYTTSSAWTMPRAMWDGLRNSSAGKDVTMTVRGGDLVNGALTNASAGTNGTFAIAPVEAPGTIVYWTTASTDFVQTGKYSPALKGFHVGDESVRDVLVPSQLPDMVSGKVQCLGCHTSTPDGLFTVATTRTVESGDGHSSINFGLVDGGAGTPPYLSDTARNLLRREYQSTAAFSPAHFSDGDRVVVTMYRGANNGDPFQMIWTDMEATSNAQNTGWGIFKRTGDNNYAAAPNVSHDGSKIVYISTKTLDTSGNIVADGKLFTVPWNNRQGGDATELAGANADGSRQFYPAFSPDDQFVAFDRSPQTGDSYDDPNAEMYVIPSTGGTAQRVVANDPPACSGAKSPPGYNSWPKWAPQVGTDGSGKKYYFMVFSSRRNNGTTRFGDRLYLTPVVVDGTTVKTYSALYLWNQPETEDNHSPSWDNLQIPDAVVK